MKMESLSEHEPATADRQAGLILRPRLGFLGVGWIGRHRMEAVARSGVAEVAALADPSAEMREAAAASVPDAEVTDSFDALLGMPLDGIVIATPSALHAEQSIAALERGFSVFCQKPLGRTGAEARRVVETARRLDRLLGVDLSYRHSEAFARARDVVRSGDIGRVYAADLTFHNAYGPDKDWFYQPALAGGGCVMDLGIHLVDMALWVLGFPAVTRAEGRLFAGGARVGDGAPESNGTSDSDGRARLGPDVVEDYATAQLDLEGGATVRIACSWNLHAGDEAVIETKFHGSGGGVSVTNVGGSFYDFATELYRGTQREALVAPPDDWGGRAAVAWSRQLADGARFDPAADELIAVANVLDRIYGRAGPPAEDGAADSMAYPLDSPAT